MEFYTTTARLGMKVELGSGPHGQPGFIHVDAVKIGNVGVVADIRRLSFRDNSISELYSAHAVEHISYTEIEEVLKDWYRVLIPGGKLTIKMPDLDFICRAYVENTHSTEEIMVAIFGGFSDYPGGPEGWEKISGNPQWDRNTIPDGKIPNPGMYTEWGAHKALYTFDSFRPRLERSGFINVRRVIRNDWELEIVCGK